MKANQRKVLGVLMKTSNVIGGSNVYPCKGSPLSDQEFVNQIEDYNYIKTIHKNQIFRQSSVCLTKKQSQLLEIEMRCVYAPKDPCWGYIDGQGVRSRCVEGRCPRIMQCNPTYTVEQADYWTMSEEAKTLYGKPGKQKKYYLVDLVSEEEKQRYISDPKGAGIEFPPMKDPEIKVTKKKKKGRQLVIIGFEETYFGDADNQLSPIWGYVDDPEEAGTMVSSRYGSRTEHIHKNAVKVSDKSKDNVDVSNKSTTTKEEIKEEVRPVIVEVIASDKKERYEQTVLGKRGNVYQLTELSSEKLRSISGNRIINIILANEAELAYVSSMLLQVAVPHDIEKLDGSESVCLWKAQTKKFNLRLGVTMVSGAFLSQGCDLTTELVWENLMKASVIEELAVSGRDFFSFKVEDNLERWGCRNLYGTTHLAIRLDDFELTEAAIDEQKITLMKDSKNYIILSTSSAEQLGITTDALWSALNTLKRMDEISEFPRIISGLTLAKNNSELVIKGIGHMKFDEY